MKKLVVAAQLFIAAAVAHAAGSVTLTGSIGSRAILIVNGNPPKTVAVGESYQGVKLVSLQADQAVVELEGKRVNLRMDTPVSIGGGGGSGGGGNRVVLSADSRGHFMTQGSINGRPVTFMLDTGATAIALSADDAQRIGLDYSKGQRVLMNTANGTATGYKLRLQSVRVGDVEVYDIDAIVSQQAMPFVLLGNSFINRFSMRRDADQMVLEKRY
ncbi:TIGR02281 family clan AA aspartic protease [Variovorax sp. NFACC27]|jgi:aspartyl protease family protein|uniref:retropepsin-like aspartic protease family protein n=1 Tax=unclassified Variovorax TaxID=663243 RepID=UPI0008984410|nr:TIGR02281 family clan AA aspartic protease [Variovorax sp. YR750]MDP9604960.1 aspartyl protease family protein [Variovorax paradoxus]SEF30357.1 aspartyl protease family protein [Variovorax sp. NFACC28]SEG86733.1 aspartyl protease family protein [Variovorax sp. NFACC29]SFD31326.1 aspartyl protease family protein [Variovorax sp. NFACC26]SFG31977.1 aspartyl protease family protein [Variovorax sp. NFACC27]